MFYIKKRSKLFFSAAKVEIVSTIRTKASLFVQKKYNHKKNHTNAATYVLQNVSFYTFINNL